MSSEPAEAIYLHRSHLVDAVWLEVAHGSCIVHHDAAAVGSRPVARCHAIHDGHHAVVHHGAEVVGAHLLIGPERVGSGPHHAVAAAAAVLMEAVESLLAHGTHLPRREAGNVRRCWRPGAGHVTRWRASYLIVAEIVALAVRLLLVQSY